MVLDKLGLFLCLPARRVNGHTGIKRIYPPSSSPLRIHFLADLFVDLLRLSFIGFVSCSGEEFVFVVWILELVRAHPEFFISPRLSFSVSKIGPFQEGSGGKNAHNCLGRITLECRTDIRTGREARGT